MKRCDTIRHSWWIVRQHRSDDANKQTGKGTPIVLPVHKKQSMFASPTVSCSLIAGPGRQCGPLGYSVIWVASQPNSTFTVSLSVSGGVNTYSVSSALEVSKAPGGTSPEQVPAVAQESFCQVWKRVIKAMLMYSVLACVRFYTLLLIVFCLSSSCEFRQGSVGHSLCLQAHVHVHGIEL